VWEFKDRITYSEVYTLVMPKIVHVQVHGIASPLSIKADEVKEELTGSSPAYRLKLMLAGSPVGEFKMDAVDGWWIEESDKSSGPGVMAL
jgi:hypothetical protein